MLQRLYSRQSTHLNPFNKSAINLANLSLRKRGDCELRNFGPSFPVVAVELKKPYMYDLLWSEPIAECSNSIRPNQSRVRDPKDSDANSPLYQILRQRHQQQSIQIVQR